MNQLDKCELAGILSILYKRYFISEYKKDINFTVKLFEDSGSGYMEFVYKYKNIEPFSVKFTQPYMHIDYNNPECIIQLFKPTSAPVEWEEWYVENYIERNKIMSESGVI